MADKQASSERYDIVIYGASGFTGQYVVEETLKVTENTNITWAVAGRSQSKLEEVLKNVFEVTGKEPKQIPIITADISNEDSLAEMCKKAKVVLNCVGPYRFYGEPVVKACIANKAHYVDISGEPQYLERMQLEYNDEAKAAGVYIIGSAGFDSIPMEAGVRFVQDKFPGDISYVESYFGAHVGEKGMSYNFGTWQSAIYGFAHSNELRALREKLCPERLPKGNFKPPSRKALFYSKDVDKWCLPFPGSDKSVVTRTQYYLYFQRKLRPFYVNTYSKYASLLSAMGTIFVACIFAFFSFFSFGRSLLENYPKFFSFGMFSKNGPTREQILGTSFSTIFVATGHKEKLAESSDQHSKSPDTKMIVKVKGPEPAYITTPICMVQSGLILLQEKDKLPEKGGVFTPGAAFHDTTLIERLSKCGMEFVSEEPQDI